MGMNVGMGNLGLIVLRQFRVCTEHAARSNGKRRGHVKDHTAEFSMELFLFFIKEVSSVTEQFALFNHFAAVFGVIPARRFVSLKIFNPGQLLGRECMDMAVIVIGK